MKIGDKIGVRGPKGNFIYTPNMAREIGMVAGKKINILIIVNIC
jgi:cytochrome-b5 reductase